MLSIFARQQHLQNLCWGFQEQSCLFGVGKKQHALYDGHRNLWTYKMVFWITQENKFLKSNMDCLSILIQKVRWFPECGKSQCWERSVWHGRVLPLPSRQPQWAHLPAPRVGVIRHSTVTCLLAFGKHAFITLALCAAGFRGGKQCGDATARNEFIFGVQLLDWQQSSLFFQPA